MKRILNILAILLMAACCGGAAFVTCYYFSPLFEPEVVEEPLVLELIIQIQEEVGARPDGIVGPEFKRLVNARTRQEEPEYCNRMAVASMERMAKGGSDE